MTALTEERMAAQQSREPDPAATAERSDDIRGLPKLLAVLPERQQEVVRLKFQNEFSYKQISEIMGLSVSNVGYLIHTAIHTLRKRAQEQHA
ncbi:MAG: sigma-70 family RNA polymerase sigma factor [Lentisphaerae bacterium]|nr:sigma-70 family RNA polymerase sigma factor [Lentisphaerota bacterium]